MRAACSEALALADDQLANVERLYLALRKASTQPTTVEGASKENTRRLKQLFLVAQKARRNPHANRTSERAYTTRLALEQVWSRELTTHSDRLFSSLDLDAAILLAQRAWITPPHDPPDGVLAGNPPGIFKRRLRKAKGDPPPKITGGEPADAAKVEAWGGKRGSMAWLALQSEDPSHVRVMRDANGDPVAVASVDAEKGDMKVRILAAKEGYGGKMMQALAKEAAQSGLGMRLVSTFGAEGFYNRIGMKQGDYVGQYGWSAAEAAAFARTGGYLPPPASGAGGTSVADMAAQQLAFNILTGTPGEVVTSKEIQQALTRAIDEEAWKTGAASAYLGLATQTSELAGQTSLEHLGINRTWAWANPRTMAQDQFSVRGSKIVQNMYGAHMDELTKIITSATDPRAPKNLAQVKAEIKERWPALRRYQVERIARTETAAVWTSTSVNAYSANGISQFESIVAHGPSIGIESEEPCDECIDAAASVHSVDDDLPPWHPNCRCEAIPVTEDEDGTPWLPPDEPFTGGADGAEPLAALEPLPPPVDAKVALPPPPDPVAPPEPAPQVAPTPEEFGPNIAATPDDAATMTMEGLRERLAATGGEAPTADKYAAGLRNWQKAYGAPGVLVYDQGLNAALREAFTANLASARYQAVIERLGQERYVFISNQQSMSPLLRIKDGASAARIHGVKVTEFNAPEIKLNLDAGALAPAAASAPGRVTDGLNGIMRHEYGHQLWYDAPEVKDEFLRLAPKDAETMRSDISLYGSTEPEEGFAETFAAVTDPKFNPAEWEPWVGEFARAVDRYAEGEAFKPLPTPALTPTTYTTETVARETTGNLWRAMSRNGHAENAAQKDIAYEQDKVIANELWARAAREPDAGLPEGTIRFTDLAGDQHLHTTYSDGHMSVEEMAEAARLRGQQKIVISDHSHLLSPGTIKREHAEIDRLNARYAKAGQNFRIYKGIEVNILEDGSLDVADAELANFDVVNAGMHVARDTNATERYLKVMDNKYVTTIAHPHTGGDVVDWQALAKKAKEKGITLEVNGRDILRLDNGPAARKMIAAAREHKVPLTFASDAHNDVVMVDLLYASRFAAKEGVTFEDIAPIQKIVDDVSIPGEAPINEETLRAIKKWRLDTPDAMPYGDKAKAVLGDAPDTRALHTDGLGAYDAEAEAAHERILSGEAKDIKGESICRVNEAAAQEKPIALVTAGGPAAGKSVALRANPGMKPEDFVNVNPDEVMPALADAPALTGDSGFAAALHEEASDVAARILDAAIAKRTNIVLDGCGNSEAGKFAEKLRQLKEAGYEVRVVMSDAGTNTAIERNIQRASKVGGPDEGRFLPIHEQKRLYRDVSARMPEWIDSPDVDSWKLMRSSGEWGDTNTRLVAEGGKGTHRVLIEDEWNLVRDKANMSIEAQPIRDVSVAPTTVEPAVEHVVPVRINDATWTEARFHDALKPHVGSDVRVTSAGFRNERHMYEGQLRWSEEDYPLMPNEHGHYVTLGNGRGVEDIEVKGADGKWYKVATKPETERAPEAVPEPEKAPEKDAFSGETVAPHERATIRTKDVALKADITTSLDRIGQHVVLPVEARPVDIVPGKGQSSNFKPEGLGRSQKWEGARIRVSTVRGEQMTLDHMDSTYHEYGHYLDWNYGPKGSWQGVRYGSEAHPEFKPLMQALHGSPEVKQWRDIFTGKFKPGPDVYTPKGHVRYMKSDVEVFARGFAQYMATVTNDTAYLRFVSEHVSLEQGGWYWTTKNFEPIKAEFDALFERLGIKVGTDVPAAPEVMASPGEVRLWEHATGSWYGKLTSAEDTAIRNYTDENSALINDTLRGVRAASANDHALAEYVRTGIGKASSPEATVYRAGPDMTALFDGAALDETLVGHEFTDKAFVSTSTGLERTTYYDTYFRIHVPEGAQAAYVRMLSEYQKEDEVIIQAGSKFTVTAVTEENGKKVIDLEVKTPEPPPIPTPEPTPEPTPAPPEYETIPQNIDYRTREGFERILTHYEGQTVRVTIRGRKYTGLVQVKNGKVLVDRGNFYRGFEDTSSIEVKVGGRYKDWREVEQGGGVEALTPKPRGSTATTPEEVAVPEGGWQFEDTPPSGRIGDYPETPEFKSVPEAEAFVQKFIAREVYFGNNPDLRGVREVVDSIASVVRPYGVKVERLQIENDPKAGAMAYYGKQVHKKMTVVIDGVKQKKYWEGEILRGQAQSLNPNTARKAGNNMENFERRKNAEVTRLMDWIDEAANRHTSQDSVDKYWTMVEEWRESPRWWVAAIDDGAQASRAFWTHEAAHAVSNNIGEELLRAGAYADKEYADEWVAAKFIERCDANSVTMIDKCHVSRYGATGDNPRQFVGSELWAETTAARMTGHWDIVPENIQKAYDETLDSISREMIDAQVARTTKRDDWKNLTDEEKAERIKGKLRAEAAAGQDAIRKRVGLAPRGGVRVR